MEIKQINIDHCSKNRIVGRNTNSYNHTKALPWMSVLQVCGGSCTVSIGNASTYTAYEGDFVITPSDSVHTLELKSEKELSFRYIYLDARINGCCSFEDHYRIPLCIRRETGGEMAKSFDKLFASNDLFSNYCCYYDILKIIFAVSKPYESVGSALLKGSLEYIEKNYASKISVSDLANISNLSQSRFYAVFSKTYGVSPVSYINSYRLAMAAELLLTTDSTVGDISNEVGILDPIYFNKLFRKSYGSSPSTFRKLYRPA